MELSGCDHVAKTSVALFDRGEAEPVAVEGPGTVEVLRRQLRYRPGVCQQPRLVIPLLVLGHDDHLSTFGCRISLRACRSFTTVRALKQGRSMRTSEKPE